MDEAIAWVRRMPAPADVPLHSEGVVEIRQVGEMEDLFLADNSPA